MEIKIIKIPKNSSWPLEKQEVCLGLVLPVEQKTETGYWVSFEKAIPIFERKSGDASKWLLNNIEEADSMFPGFLIFEKEDCEVIMLDKSVQK